MQYEKNVGLLYHRSCILCYELYICSDLDGIVWVKNAPSKLIRAPYSPQASKWTDKNLLEANFVKLAVVDFFLLPTYFFLPFAWKDVWFGVLAVWFDVTVGLVVNGPWQSLHCMRCYHVESPDGISLNAAVCAHKAQRGEWSRGNQAESVPSDEIHEQKKENNLGLKVLCLGTWWGVIGQSDLQPQGFLMADWRCDFFSAHQS